MNDRMVTAAALLAVLGGTTVSAQTQPGYADTLSKRTALTEHTIRSGPYTASWESLERHETPAWYVDGKFGIFIHWGLYSVPAFGSEWYPRNMYQQGSPEYNHHVETFGPQSKFGYKDFIPMFRAENYRPDDWAALFKEAGARFVVPVAEHHDGFAMYDTALSEWSAAKMGPKRDLIGDLAKAVRKEGLVFGLSSHRAEHYFFMNGGRKFDSDVQDPKYADFYGPAAPDGQPADTAFLDDWLARCTELVDKYKPQLFWFDWWIEQPEFKPYLRKFAAYYYNRGARWRRGVAINYKNAAFPPKAAVYDIERGRLAGIRPIFWQTDTAVSRNSWGYVTNQDYKAADDIIDDLVDIVSKNGALLLNIGPRPDGTIPEPEQQILRDIGAWLKVNGEAIYGTRPWIRYGEGPTQVVGGSFKDTERGRFTGRDIRFTTKGGTLYAIAMAWPGEEVTITSLGRDAGLVSGEPRTVSLLGSDAKLSWKVTGAGLVVRLPAREPSQRGAALKITGLKWLRSHPAVTMTNNEARLLPRDATLHGSKLQVESRGGAENIGYWDDAGEWASWSVRVPAGGTITVMGEYASAAGDVPLTLELAGGSLDVTAPKTDGWDDFRSIRFGSITGIKGGTVELAVRARAGAPWKPLNLRRISLVWAEG